MTEALSPLPPAGREPDFERNLLAVLHRQCPARPTLYELFLNRRLYDRFCDPALRARLKPETSRADWQRLLISAYARAGYDYAHADAPWRFPMKEQEHAATISQNDGGMIADRASYDAYPWPDPDRADYGFLDEVAGDMPAGMKLVPLCPSGVLENAVNLVGYEALCLLVYDDPGLAEDIFAAIGKRLVRHQEIVAAHPAVGAAMCNDDWGHHTQTLLPPDLHRKYVLPWHAKMVETIHRHGKPALLHSCGNLERVMDDVVAVGFDAKHSFEDSICPVEAMYDRWIDRIAVLGGVDVDFLCRRPPAEITARGRAMFARADAKGGYALGTGNSVPLYVDDERYLAMTRAALES